MMEKLKQRWNIDRNWQLVFPFLGVLLVLLTAYSFARKLLHTFDLNNTFYEWPFTLGITAVLYVLMVRFFLWCFKKLENRWKVEHDWEMIAIFIVFAITGSVSAKLAAPLTELIGLEKRLFLGGFTGPYVFFLFSRFIRCCWYVLAGFLGNSSFSGALKKRCSNTWG